MLHRLQRARVLAVGGVDLCLGKDAPGGCAGSGLNLGRNVLVQCGVGQQTSLDEMDIVFGKLVGELRDIRGLDEGEERGGRCGGLRAESGDSLTGEDRVVVVGIIGDECAVVVQRLSVVMLFVFVDAAAPVECAGDVLPCRIALQLFIHQTCRFNVVAHTVVHPRCTPVCGGCIGAGGKDLDQCCVVEDRLGVVALEQIHVAAGVERLLQPVAVRELLH